MSKLDINDNGYYIGPKYDPDGRKTFHPFSEIINIRKCGNGWINDNYLWHKEDGPSNGERYYLHGHPLAKDQFDEFVTKKAAYISKMNNENKPPQEMAAGHQLDLKLPEAKSTVAAEEQLFAGLSSEEIDAKIIKDLDAAVLELDKKLSYTDEGYVSFPSFNDYPEHLETKPKSETESIFNNLTSDTLKSNDILKTTSISDLHKIFNELADEVERTARSAGLMTKEKAEYFGGDDLVMADFVVPTPAEKLALPKDKETLNAIEELRKVYNNTLKDGEKPILASDIGQTVSNDDVRIKASYFGEPSKHMVGSDHIHLAGPVVDGLKKDIKKEIKAELEKAFDLDWHPEDKKEDDIDWSKYHKQIKENASKFIEKETAVQRLKDKDHLINKMVEEHAKTIEDIKKSMDELKKDVQDKPVPFSGYHPFDSYSEASSFVGALINLGIIDSTDFVKTINKCEKWSQDDQLAIRKCVNSYIAGNLSSSLTQIKTLIQKANDRAATMAPVKSRDKIVEHLDNNISNFSVSIGSNTTSISLNGSNFFFDNKMSKESKARLLHDMYLAAPKVKDYMKRWISPSLSEEDIDYWLKNYYGETATKAEKKQSKTTKEVEKINNLIADKNIDIKELDKYVALGIISSAGLKAWRIEDQSKNDYFYNDFQGEDDALIYDEAIPFELSDDEVNDFLDEITRPASKFETEAGKAAYRVAGTQVSNITRAAIIKALPADKAETMKLFLSSELGAGFVNMVGGITLTYGMESNHKAQKLAKELRVSGLSILGNEAVDALMTGTFDAIKNTVMELPKEISIVDESLEEELEMLRLQGQKNEQEMSI